MLISKGTRRASFVVLVPRAAGFFRGARKFFFCHLASVATIDISSVGYIQGLGGGDIGMSKTAIVAGTYFANRDGEQRSDIIRKLCKEGRRIELKREPDNPQDPNAIAVFLIVPGFFGSKLKQIGYVKAGTAGHLAKKIDAGLAVRAVVQSFWAPPGKETPRVTIEYE